MKKYYKCISDEYTNYRQGYIYRESEMGVHLCDHPEDWEQVQVYPSTTELIQCIENGINKDLIVERLRDWEIEKWIKN